MRNRWPSADSLRQPAFHLVARAYVAVHDAAQMPRITGRRTDDSKPIHGYQRHMCWLPFRLGLKDEHDLHPPQAIVLLHALKAAQPLAGLTGRKAIDELGHVLAGNASIDLDRLFSDSPRKLIEVTYKALARDEGDKTVSKMPVGIVDLLLLMLIGLGCDGLTRMQLCALCPRLAIPGLSLCLAHSQSKRAAGSPSLKAAGYRESCEVAALYHYYVPGVPAFVQLSEETLPTFLRRLLWNATLPDEARTMRAIKHHVESNQVLQHWLGMDEAHAWPHDMYDALESSIDPYEVRPKVWLWKLQRLRLWTMYQHVAAKQRERGSTRLLMKIIRAKEMEQWGYTRAEIARSLDVQRSAISNWLARTGTSSISEAAEVLIERAMVKRPGSLAEFEASLRSAPSP